MAKGSIKEKITGFMLKYMMFIVPFLIFGYLCYSNYSILTAGRVIIYFIGSWIGGILSSLFILTIIIGITNAKGSPSNIDDIIDKSPFDPRD